MFLTTVELFITKQREHLDSHKSFLESRMVAQRSRLNETAGDEEGGLQCCERSYAKPRCAEPRVWPEMSSLHLGYSGKCGD